MYCYKWRVEELLSLGIAEEIHEQASKSLKIASENGLQPNLLPASRGMLELCTKKFVQKLCTRTVYKKQETFCTQVRTLGIVSHSSIRDSEIIARFK